MKIPPLPGAVAAALLVAVSGPSIAQTPAAAYNAGCASCHSSERAVLRAIPRVPDTERRAWIEKFMTQHPCERDDLKPLILDYLLERSRS